MRSVELEKGLRKIFSPRATYLWLIVSVLVGLTGPLGTFATMAVPLRLVYWTLLLAGAPPVAAVCRRALRRWLRGLGVWVRASITSAVFSCIYTPLIYALTVTLEHRGLAVSVSGWMLWVAVFLSSITETAIWRLTRPTQAAPVAPEATELPEDPRPAPPRLFARLPAAVQAPVISVSVRDHYVVVTTAAGQASVLMRFADAITELDGVAGMQVHRSHWVADAAVQGLERRGGRVFIALTGGREVPVSRSYLEPVTARWGGKGTTSDGAPVSTATASRPIRLSSAGSEHDRPPV